MLGSPVHAGAVVLVNFVVAVTVGFYSISLSLLKTGVGNPVPCTADNNRNQPSRLKIKYSMSDVLQNRTNGTPMSGNTNKYLPIPFP